MQSPSDDLVKLLIKKVRPELKHVGKNVMAQIKPTVLEIWHEFAQGGTGGGPAPPPPRPNGDVQVPIIGYFKKGPMAGHRFNANLLLSEKNGELESVVVYEGQEFTPSGAARHALEKKFGTKPSVNGFWFWKVKDPLTGTERPMLDVRTDDEFRHRLLRST